MAVCLFVWDYFPSPLRTHWMVSGRTRRLFLWGSKYIHLLALQADKGEAAIRGGRPGVVALAALRQLLSPQDEGPPRAWGCQWVSAPPLPEDPRQRTQTQSCSSLTSSSSSVPAAFLLEGGSEAEPLDRQCCLSVASKHFWVAQTESETCTCHLQTPWY